MLRIRFLTLALLVVARAGMAVNGASGTWNSAIRRTGIWGWNALSKYRDKKHLNHAAARSAAVPAFSKFTFTAEKTPPES